MNGKLAIRVILVNLAALALLVFVYPELMVSPGHLSDGHRQLETDCFACHAPLRGTPSASCVECHAVERIGLFNTRGEPLPRREMKLSFHQKLTEGECTACHGDHRGPAGADALREFSHALLQPAVRERCAGCHAAPEDPLHRKVEGNCTQCHTQDRWTPATFDHDRYFRFDRHHDTDCVTCHQGNDYSRYTCYGCHEHSPGKIREEHWEEGIRDYENCVECHRSGDEDEAERLWKSKGGGWRGGDDDHHRRGHDDD